jgi:hypothetical protein
MFDERGTASDGESRYLYDRRHQVNSSLGVGLSHMYTRVSAFENSTAYAIWGFFSAISTPDTHYRQLRDNTRANGFRVCWRWSK